MSDRAFVVERIEQLEVIDGSLLHQRELMSPYVWRAKEGELHILIRAVPQPGDGDRITGRIWHGVGANDGLAFRMDAESLLTPGPDTFDIMGCEDPTLVPTSEGCILYYTGLDQDLNAEMLYAAGPDIRSLEKRGRVFQSGKTQNNTKEATVCITKDGEWRLFYEFAHDEASLIGVAVGKGPTGPWSEYSEPFAPRPDRWDNWHISTGPILYDRPDRPVMFYNGASRDAVWRIGWVELSRDCLEVVDRGVEPLFEPPEGVKHRDIAFASSLVAEDGWIWLYFSVDDRELYRATLLRTDGSASTGKSYP